MLENLEKTQSKIVCNFCEQYAGRVGRIREYGCPDCEVGCIPEGHHHHILFPPLEEVERKIECLRKNRTEIKITPQLKMEFEEWKRMKQENS